MEQNKGKTILVVDDDKEMSQLLSNELTKERYNVEVAERLGEILEQVKGPASTLVKASLIIVNLETPDIPGWETVSMIKKLNKTIPIITITDDDAIEIERKVREEGVFFYFVKPFTIEDMKEVIKSAIGTCHSDPFTCHSASRMNGKESL